MGWEGGRCSSGVCKTNYDFMYDRSQKARGLKRREAVPGCE
jgi:hypothetical protein